MASPVEMVTDIISLKVPLLPISIRRRWERFCYTALLHGGVCAPGVRLLLDTSSRDRIRLEKWEDFCIYSILPEPIHQPHFLDHYHDLCDRFAITEFVYTVLIFTIAEIFLALRVYVLTRKNIYLALILVLLILAQLGLAFYIMSRGGSGHPDGASVSPINPSQLVNPNVLQVCVLIPVASTLKYDTIYLSLALSFDAFVFIATLIATFAAARQYRAKPWLRVIQRDGIIYFMAIFSSTLIWLLLGQVARPGLKLVNAILYLQLKKAGREEEPHHLFLGKGERPQTDMELQVIVSQHITSVMI
ncbi:hypothetical protein DXG01_008255 [Tephrocybe rancida]|nr:hypothetical protein DXG01_008255 [Tephrocybe rancida]